MTKIFAISGGHLMGKTALCHAICSELIADEHQVGFVEEAVRRSQLIFGGGRSVEMHLETAMLHVIAELTAASIFEVLICDRSIVDYLAYANLRFPKLQNNVVLDTLTATAESYANNYQKIFILKSNTISTTQGNFREDENIDSIQMSEECALICERLQLAFEVVELDAGSERTAYVLKGISSLL